MKRSILNLYHNVAALWNPIIFFLAPLVLLLIPLLVHTKEAKCAYMMIVMALFWMTEPVPLAVTSLVPIVFSPLMGVASTKIVCEAYANKTLMMFVGGLMVATAVEHCNLHQRIALRVLLWVGTSLRWLMLGFMLTTMFLSMWISNTAATAMMVPIVEAVLEEISDEQETRKENISLKKINPPDGSNMELNNGMVQETNSINNQQPTHHSTVRKVLLLSVAFSANCGGTGTLTGTGPNLVLKALYDTYFPQSKDITYGSWIVYNVPGMLLYVLVAWWFLFFYFTGTYCKSKENGKKREAVREVILRKYNSLDQISFHETAVLILFILLILLWLMRDPEFLPGWGPALSSDVHIDDATPAIFIALLLFIIPAKPSQLRSSPPLLDWKTAQNKLPWGVLFILGGGFSLAKVSEISGLSRWMSNQLSYLDSMPPVAIVIVLCILTATLTEVVSNVVSATILLPVIKQLSLALKVHPLYLMLPVTISCSFAFMLPVATAPNTMVFEIARMKTLDMVKPGFFLNILCICIQTMMIHTLGDALFHFNTIPYWMNVNTTLTTTFSSVLPEAVDNLTIHRITAISFLNMTST
ncbi:solute carrier family 13 member 5-like isoform X2 [Limulus polyphemus]|uniref:Solute carrier family 13 member 5-like isoform X2 n=1 Tax=Limulus polyphemus TaxID=6850 RepID=A0ABM1S1N8_LIMPO|nr:solute carrier family 13 member 5-like isoform X2 [Limulus polyphemus]